MLIADRADLRVNLSPGMAGMANATRNFRRMWHLKRIIGKTAGLLFIPHSGTTWRCFQPSSLKALAVVSFDRWHTNMRPLKERALETWNNLDQYYSLVYTLHVHILAGGFYSCQMYFCFLKKSSIVDIPNHHCLQYCSSKHAAVGSLKPLGSSVASVCTAGAIGDPLGCTTWRVRNRTL